jgi:hypothetical protein
LRDLASEKKRDSAYVALAIICVLLTEYVIRVHKFKISTNFS